MLRSVEGSECRATRDFTDTDTRMLSAPREVPIDPNDEDLISYFGLKERNPKIVPEPRKQIQAFLVKYGARLEEKERAFLTKIRSEIVIPVVFGDKVTGVIGVVAWHERAFADELIPVVRDLTHSVGIWLELAHRDAGQGWIQRVLKDCSDVLPQLVRVEPGQDQRWFAGLATMLSAFQGLQWHRVMIFSCDDHANPNAARLVYALGGLTGLDDIEYHRRLQHAIGDDTSATLNSLVCRRIMHPPPHHTDKSESFTDRLYTKCVGSPIGNVLDFGGFRCDPQVAADPLIQVMGHDYTRPPTFEIPVRVFQGDPDHPVNAVALPLSIQALNSQAAGMFAADRNIYAVPLWSPLTPDGRLLGIVLLDMQQPGHQRTEDMIAATRVVMGLVSDLLAMRIVNRIFRGWIHTLPGVNHRANLAFLWKSFSRNVTDIFPGFTEQLDDRERIGEALEAGFERLGHEPELWTSLHKRYKQIDEIIKEIHNPAHDNETDTDLKRFLTSLEPDYNSYTRVGMHILLECRDLPDRLTLECNPAVLQDAIKSLLQNTQEALNKRKMQGLSTNGEVRIWARLVTTKYTNLSRIIEVHYLDKAGGIEKGCKEYIFMNRFSTTGDSKRGKGLSLTRTQLIAYHGDIQLVEDVVENAPKGGYGTEPAGRGDAQSVEKVGEGDTFPHYTRAWP